MNKKFLALILSAAIVLTAFGACGKKEGGEEASPSTAEAAMEVNATDSAATDSDGEEQMAEIEEDASASDGIDSPLPSETPQASLDPYNAQSLLNAPMETKTDNGSNYSILLSYPVFNIANLDAAVQGALESQVAEFKQEASETENIENESFILSAQSEVLAGGSRYVTVKIDSGWDLGGAHPAPFLEMVCYDLQEGKSLALKDVFKQDSDYLPLLSELCKEALLLESEWLNGTLDENGLTPEEHNFSNFALLDDGLLFCFPPYQVASYADGEQSVILPYTELESVLAVEKP